jgi:Tol biopolymer transport system component
VAGGAAVHLSAAASVNPAHPAWSPDGTQIVVEGYTRDFPKRLHLVDSTSGATVQLTADDGEHPSWIP